MRFIPKNRITPDAFQAAVNGVTSYNNLYGNQKQALLKVLIEEQSGLCAYCNQPVTVNTATVEHFICQSHSPSFDLKYFNLIAVCRGNPGNNVDLKHCDKYRAEKYKNDYFVPFFLFDKCLTQNLNSPNPFFDVEYNPRTQLFSGRIIPRNQNMQGYPRNESRIREAIDVLNLNAQVLVEARKQKWYTVEDTREKLGLTWEDLFQNYLNMPGAGFSEFILLAIRKKIQEP
jgi:uncharacterized protein (TIGR02646 family)